MHWEHNIAMSQPHASASCNVLGAVFGHTDYYVVGVHGEADVAFI